MIRVLLFLCLFLDLSAKVRLLTFQYNSPELIELQQRAFKKLMAEEHEIILINDADNLDCEEAIRRMCEKQGIQCVRYQQEWHQLDPLNDQIREWMGVDPQRVGHFLGGFKEHPDQHPSVRHSHLIQFALDHFGYDHDDIVVIVDGDLFPIRPFRLREWFKEGEILGIEPFRAPFIAFHPKALPEVRTLKFGVSYFDHSFQDTGGYCQYYLKEHPEVRFIGYPQKETRELSHLPYAELMKLGFREEEARLVMTLPSRFNIEFHLDNYFIHLGSSVSNLLGVKMKLKHIYSWIDDVK